MLQKPERDEYEDYYHTYVGRVPDGNVLDLFSRQLEELAGLVGDIGEDRAAYRYAPDKWSIKEVFGHLLDTERMFAYRAMVFARADKTPQPSFEQDDYVRGANFDARALADIFAELQQNRLATLAMFRSFTDEVWLRRGTASGFEFTVRAVPYIMAGHHIHHVGVLRERYL